MAQALWMLVFGLGCSTVTPADSETDEPVDGDTDTDLETDSDEYPLSGSAPRSGWRWRGRNDSILPPRDVFNRGDRT